MGGLSGHMMHPHDNHELTIGQFKNLLAGSMQGAYPMTEKIDGFNIHFMRYNGEIRFARNGKDILEGGFGQQDIANRFSNDRVRLVFAVAYDMVTKLPVDSIPEFTKTHKTINAEIVVEGTTNIMYYAKTAIIPHNIWIWDGKAGTPCEEIKNNMVLKYTPMNKGLVRNMINQLTGEEFAPLGLTENNSLYDYYAIRFALVMSEMFPELVKECPEVLRILFNRFMGIDKTNLREIRKMTTANIGPILDAEKRIMQVVKEPLDRWVLKIGTAMLEHANGFNSANHCGYRAAAMLEESIMHADKNETFKRRWEYCDNKIFGMEGLVVEFEGNLYKFTGPFAPINQLLGGQRK